MVTRFKNGWVLKNHRIYPDELRADGGKIIEPQSFADEEVDVERAIIAPGYIDLQINGGYGEDFSTPGASFDLFSQKILRHGVTSFLPTIVSSPQQNYPRILTDVKPSGANILGFHLEGPFLNEKRKGAHTHIRTFEGIDTLEAFYGTLKHVKMVTLAPELPNAGKYIAELKERGILAAAGHTDATFEEMRQAIPLGMTMVTHVYNAMAPFLARQPGVIGAALTESGVYYSLIADGVHCHPAAIQLAFNAKHKGMILISDAMAALGLPEGDYTLGSQAVTVKNGKAVLKDKEQLAGSVTGLDAAVRYLNQAAGCSIVDAIEAASLHPAQLLNMPQKGNLLPGADADFILLDDQLQVHSTYVAGQGLFNK